MSYHSAVKRGIYYAAPYPLKNVLSSWYGRQQRRARLGSAFHSTLDLLQESQFWDRARLGEYEEQVLEEFLPAAIGNCAYYRGQPAYAGSRSGDDLRRLPVLAKAEVQANLERFYADGFRDQPHHWGHTSGTTGRSLIFPISDACFQREYAFRALHLSWGGVDFVGGDRIAYCSGHPVAHRDRRRPPFWVHDWSNHWLLLSSYHLTEKNLRAYVNKLDAFRPVTLAGYPSSLYLLALAYARYGSGRMRLRSVFVASETLLEFQRLAMEQNFGTKVFNWYGNSELCGHITECEQGTLHVRHEHSLLEVLDSDGQPCAPGQTGRLVVTGFHNPVFPLIRYDVGDEVTLSAEANCGCGRGGLLVAELVGRVEDYVATPDGRLVGRLDHLFKDAQNVSEAQIVQDRLEEVVLRIVRRSGYGPEDERKIVNEARLRLGSAIRISFDYVDRIERTASGKFRFVVSSLDQRRLLQGLAEI